MQHPFGAPFGGPAGLVKSVSHFIVIAESINTGILQHSVGFLGALKAMHSGAIPGGAAAGAGTAGGAL